MFGGKDSVLGLASFERSRLPLGWKRGGGAWAPPCAHRPHSWHVQLPQATRTPPLTGPLGAAPTRGALTTVPVTRPRRGGRPGDQGLTLPGSDQGPESKPCGRGEKHGAAGRASVHAARGVFEGPFPEARGPLREPGADGQASGKAPGSGQKPPDSARAPARAGNPELLSETPARPPSALALSSGPQLGPRAPRRPGPPARDCPPEL